MRRRGVNCRLCLARCAERADAVEFGAQPVFLDLQVITGLQVHPEPLGGAEVPGQPQRGVRGNAALAVDDLVDPPGRDIYRLVRRTPMFWLMGDSLKDAPVDSSTPGS